eukprot:Opistho-2@8444
MGGGAAGGPEGGRVMPSPFPGMDPYLEDPDLWPDVHGTLLPLIRGQITAALPPGYVAKIDQHVWLSAEEPGETAVLGRPDVFVAEGEGTGATLPASAVTTGPTEYVKLAPLKRRRGARFVQIVDKRRRRVVTVVELLSPSNKEYGTEDRARYLEKRTEYLGTGTSLVEIDLLRVGDRVPMGRPKGFPADYYLLVSRASEFPKAAIWGFTVRDPIPVLPVPLKTGDPDVTIDLRAPMYSALI